MKCQLFSLMMTTMWGMWSMTRWKLILLEASNLQSKRVLRMRLLQVCQIEEARDCLQCSWVMKISFWKSPLYLSYYSCCCLVWLECLRSYTSLQRVRRIALCYYCIFFRDYSCSCFSFRAIVLACSQVSWVFCCISSYYLCLTASSAQYSFIFLVFSASSSEIFFSYYYLNLSQANFSCFFYCCTLSSMLFCFPSRSLIFSQYYMTIFASLSAYYCLFWFYDSRSFSCFSYRVFSFSSKAVFSSSAFLCLRNSQSLSSSQLFPTFFRALSLLSGRSFVVFIGS